MRKELRKTVLLLITLTILLSSCKGSGNNSSGDNSNDPVVTVEHSEKEPALAPEELIHKYYSLMSNRDTLKEAYELSTKKVDYEKFYSWYKDVKEVNVGEIESLGDDRYRFDIIMLEQPVAGTVETYYFDVTLKLGSDRILESTSKTIEDISPSGKEIIKIDRSTSPFNYFDNEMTDEEAPVITVEGVEYYLLGEGDGKEILIERKKPYEVKYGDIMVKNVGDKFYLKDKASGEIEFYRNTEFSGEKNPYFACKKNSAYYVDGNIITIKYFKQVQMDENYQALQYIVDYPMNELSKLSIGGYSDVYFVDVAPLNNYLVSTVDDFIYFVPFKVNDAKHLYSSIFYKDIFQEVKKFKYDFISWGQQVESGVNDIWCTSFDNVYLDKIVKYNRSENEKYDVSNLYLTQYDHLLNHEYGLLFYSEYNVEDKEFILFIYNLSEESKIKISSSSRPFKPYFKDRDTLMYFSPEVDGFVEYKMPITN